MGAKGARRSTGTEGNPRKILSTFHPNTILKPNLCPNAHPNHKPSANPTRSPSPNPNPDPSPYPNQD